MKLPSMMGAMAVGESTFALGTKLIFPFSIGDPSIVAVPEREMPDGPQATKVLKQPRSNTARRQFGTEVIRNMDLGW